MGAARTFNSHASPSPVIEPGRVYVHFGSAGTACIDTKSFAVLWTRTDWAFAVESLHVAARTVENQSDPKWFSELRQRERIMGTTLDARRDLRIRYVPAVAAVEETRSEVVELDDYRSL